MTRLQQEPQRFGFLFQKDSLALQLADPQGEFMPALLDFFHGRHWFCHSLCWCHGLNMAQGPDFFPQIFSEE
jgi:hypothetical protein